MSWLTIVTALFCQVSMFLITILGRLIFGFEVRGHQLEGDALIPHMALSLCSVGLGLVCDRDGAVFVFTQNVLL